MKKGREHTGVGGSSLGGVAALTALLKRPDVFGIGLLESTSMQYGNGELLRETSPIVVGPVRVSVGVGTEELGPDAKMLGVPDYDPAFVAMNRQLADNLKAALANKPQVLFTRAAERKPRRSGMGFPLSGGDQIFVSSDTLKAWSV